MPFRILTVISLFIFTANIAHADFGWFKDKFNKLKDSNLESVKDTKLSDTKIADGLKEALKVGINNAVEITSQENGYLKNEDIKIALPDKIKKLDSMLRKVGMGPKIDEFILSMNRSAEKAAPMAEDIFINALMDMSINDVQNIYSGGDTAATEYFKGKTYDELFSTFQPVVQKTMDEYDVTRKYNDLIGKYKKLPFAGKLPNIDAEEYVLSKSLDGLYHVLGQEEQKIRTDPQARVTQVLKDVFGKKE